MGATADRVFNLVTKSKDINSFYNTLLGMPPPKNDSYPWGVRKFSEDILRRDGN